MSGPETGHPHTSGRTLAELVEDAAGIIAAHAAAPQVLECCHQPGVCGRLVWARRMCPQPPDTADAGDGEEQ